MLLSLFALALSTGAISQTQNFGEDWRWAHFTAESGLPSNIIRSIFETEAGTVWIRTETGIAWFDEYQWHRIPVGGNATEFDGLKDFWGQGDSVLFLSDHQFHFGGRWGVRQPFVTPGAEYAVPFSEKTFLVCWKGTLYIAEGDTVRVFQPGGIVPSGKAISVATSRKGTVWAFFTDGVYELVNGGWKLRISHGPRPPIGDILVENEKGSGLLYTNAPIEMQGIWEWSNGSQPVLNISERRGKVVAIDIAPDNEAIVAFESGEIRIRRDGKWSEVSLKQFNINNILFFKYRNSGDLWIGTENGLYLGQRADPYWTFRRDPARKFHPSINQILRRRDGSLWLATAEGIQIHEPDGTIRDIRRIGSTPLYSLTALAEDRHGNVWISSGSQFPGAFRWDGKQWKHFSICEDSLRPYIHRIIRDRSDRLWFCGLDKLGGNVEGPQPGAYVLENGTFSRWGTEKGLLNGRVYSVAEGLDGALWFGTFEGISRWNNGRWRHWTRDNGLKSNRIFVLIVVQDGTLWFGHSGTVNAGLGFIDKEEQVRYRTTSDGLIDNVIWDLAEDQGGALWITTQTGLSSYTKGVFSSYGERSGLVCPILWPVVPHEKDVYVGTRWNGLGVLNHTRPSPPPPRIVPGKPIVEGDAAYLAWSAFAYWGQLRPNEILTRYKLNDGEWSDWTTKHDVSLSELSSGQQFLQVQAKGVIGQFAPEGSRIAFTIDPPLWLRPVFLVPTSILATGVLVLFGVLLWRKRAYDLALRASEEKFRTLANTTASAIFVLRDDTILYVNPSGEKLTGRSADKLLNTSFLALVQPDDRNRAESLLQIGSFDAGPASGLEYRITTASGDVRWIDALAAVMHFHGSPAIVLTAFDITARKESEQRLRDLSSELVLTEERERRRMATFLHDVISQNLAVGKLKVSTILKSGAQDGASQQLKEIRSLLDQSLNDAQSLTFDLCPPILYELDFATAVDWLTQRIGRQNDCSIVCEDDGIAKPLADDHRAVLFQAVREAIVNAVKHAEASTINVSLSGVDSTIRIDIRDDGKGICDNGADQGSGSETRRGGFGLFNIRERLGYLGGTVQIASIPGKGTCVTLTAPLNHSKTENNSGEQSP